MNALLSEIASIRETEIYGRVHSVQGLLVQISGPVHTISVGSRLRIAEGLRERVLCEVVGFRDGRALAMPFGPLEGVRLGAKVILETANAAVRPSRAWLGRVVNALGQPIDGKGPLVNGPESCPVRASPPPAHCRARVGAPIDLGVRALNTFATCCKGQRMGIFAGSGVGKSVLLSMLARNTDCDISIIGLIGERGREVQEFIADDLGPEGLARSIIVVATSDEAALMRRQSAYLTLTLSEYFRDQGADVLCMMDSVTRSGLFTVLVEGDDHNEPIADAVRGILDGHIVMERAIAERGRYPAINVLKSISRTMPACIADEHRPQVARARALMATFAEMEELIRLGAYRQGSNPAVDEAIAYQPQLEAFLSQDRKESASLGTAYAELARILRADSASNIKEIEGTAL